MNRVVKILIPAILCSLIIAVPSLWAAWIEDGVPICTATSSQVFPKIVSDGEGGAIFSWYDSRNGDWDVYVQRINASGTVLWTADGVLVCTAAGTQRSPELMSDGAGGAIVTWMDERSGEYQYDIYVQHVNAAGTVEWTTDGVPVCTAAQGQYYPVLISDGAGGAIVSWHDRRDDEGEIPPEGIIYAQRVNAAGTVLWTTDGVPLCTSTGWLNYPEIISDGAGGAIVTWEDRRSGYSDIYAQRVNASGTVLWTADGTPICVADEHQEIPMIISDEAGGAIITWQDGRNGNGDIYVQRINASGTVQWTADGTPICTAADAQGNPEIISDGTGGAIIAWGDRRSGDSEIYLQLINSSGTVQWPADGVSICMDGGHPHYEEYHPYNPELASDGAGGAIVAWGDGRDDEGDIYAQHIDNSGTLQWSPDGEPLCTATFVQRFHEIASDGAGGAIVVWEDSRMGSVWSSDIYAQQTTYVITDAETPETPHTAYLKQNFPNPFNPQTTIRFGLDKPGPVSLKIYDTAGRLVATIIDKAMPAGNYSETWDGKDSNGSAVSSGVYFYKLETGSTSEKRKMILLR